MTKKELNSYTKRDDYLVQFIMRSLLRSKTELGKKYRVVKKFFDSHPKEYRTIKEVKIANEYALFMVNLKLSAYKEISRLTNHERADLLEYDDKLDDFLKNFKFEESR
jgi:hypothetical protein